MFIVETVLVCGTAILLGTYRFVCIIADKEPKWYREQVRILERARKQAMYNAGVEPQIKHEYWVKERQRIEADMIELAKKLDD
jgi:hypothetical protein